ncbi:MAG TPA: circularly permuted type 2 ATP-grasp protein [Rubrobacteraceae bacterium]|nr:circularly permuted type 2 ATP-grasp protein [Rubrobacteraceae bacterium]
MKIKTKHFNEVFEPGGEIRELYRPLFQGLERLGEEELAGRSARAGEKLRDLGATFPLPDDPTGKERILPADWIPRIVPRDHREILSRGLLQRGYAINAWLTDLYNGEQDVVPEEIVKSSVLYRPGPLPDHSIPVHIYGPDVVQLGPKEYVVLEDNVRVPSGVAYAEAIRRAGLEAMGELYKPYRVSAISAYYAVLKRSLESAAPVGVEKPCVAVVSRGKEDSAYFEHSRIAAACNFRLLTLAGCEVRGEEVRDRSDGCRIDVIYRRFDEDYMETDLPELEAVYLEGKVNIVNAPGVGVADDKAVFPYVPTMIEHYLGEKPLLNNAPTFSPSQPEHKAEVLDRLEDLVLKPREGYGGKGLVIGPEAGPEDLEQARHEMEENPLNYSAQEFLDFSTHVLKNDGAGLEEAFIDLRAFVLPAIGYVMPGGLTRVASPGTHVVNSSAGGSFKDTWVLED